MSITLTETPANSDFATGPLVPSDGDDFTASCDLITNVTVQKLADRSQALNRLLGMQGTNLSTRYVDITGAGMFGSTEFSPIFVGTPPNFGAAWTQTNVAGAGQIGFCLPIPVGATLNRITARVGNIAAAHGSLPGVMPTIRVVSMVDGLVTNIGSSTDSSANTTAYDAIHDLSCTYAHVVQDGNYYVIVTGETGGGAAASKFSIFSIHFLLKGL